MYERFNFKIDVNLVYILITERTFPYRVIAKNHLFLQIKLLNSNINLIKLEGENLFPLTLKVN